MRSFPLLIASVFLVGLAALPAAATPWPERVGRVSLAESGAGVRPVGGEWSGAVVNEPVTSGTSIRTGDHGHAEIRLPGIAAALVPETTLDIVRIDDGAVQLALSAGHIDVSVDGRNAAKLEVDTAKGPVDLDGPGRYGIDSDNGLVGKLAAPANVAVSDQVPATMAGAAALVGNGDWERSAIGAIWYPKDLPAGWVPFRDGSWRYLQPWGWTWIDAAPWGFAPSHYGRWTQIGGRWGWVPGGHDAAARFVPATVAFLGTPGIGLSYAGGSGPAIAWFPLAPGEAYWPAAKGDPPASMINAAYKYRRFASAVPRSVFVGGRPALTALVDIPDRRLDVAPVMPWSPRLSAPAPKLVVALQPSVPKPTALRPQGTAPAKAEPTRIALFAPVRKHAKHVANLHNTHPSSAKVAAAAAHADHDRRHIAEAHHILRQ